MKKHLFKIIYPEFSSSLHLDQCLTTPYNFLSKSMKDSGRVPIKSKKYKLLLTSFSQSVDLYSGNAFRQLCQKLYAQYPLFPLKDKKRSTKYSCVLKKSWKCSSGRVGYSFEKKMLQCFANSPRFFAQIPKLMKKTSFWNWFSTRISLCTYKLLFSNTSLSFQPEDKNSLILEKKPNKKNSWGKNFFLKLFLCARGLQWWQPWRKLVDLSPSFCSKSDEGWNHVQSFKQCFPIKPSKVAVLKTLSIFSDKVEKKELAE